ncbi:hypothetical protein ABQF15_17100 [Xanthomonas campestris]|uniref:hypothetical protein n=2 Tax=Xanthomonas campestris TaxID=339 RepID=UPI0032E3BBF3
MARDTTPFNCEQHCVHPRLGLVCYCQGIENMTEALRQGRPAPSDFIIALPGLGTADAKQLSYACVSKQAMKLLQVNGYDARTG